MKWPLITCNTSRNTSFFNDRTSDVVDVLVSRTILTLSNSPAYWSPGGCGCEEEEEEEEDDDDGVAPSRCLLNFILDRAMRNEKKN